MIESYSFGRIIIDGKSYDSDLIILPDRVRDHWWRKEGHRLNMKDLKDTLEVRPDVLIVGTGYNGLMEVSEDVKKYIASRRIELIIEKTNEACKTYNRLSQVKKVVAAFHLTC